MAITSLLPMMPLDVNVTPFVPPVLLLEDA
jgi:hypothetical protein